MRPTKDEENKLGELAGNPAIEGLVWHWGKLGYTSKIPVLKCETTKTEGPEPTTWLQRVVTY